MPTSIATLCRTAFRGQRLAAGDDRDQFGEHPFGERDVGGFAGQRHRVAAHVQIGGQEALECAQIFVGGTEQAHDEVGRNVDAAANRRCRTGQQRWFRGASRGF